MTGSDRKKGSEKILRFLNKLQQKRWMSYGDRKWWIDYLFHFTDIRNAVSILTSGSLLSRNEAERRFPGFRDAADPKVIRRTETYRPELFDYVRFYFRPHNATAYRMEEFKPGQNPVPVPIYLLFDMREIITSKKTRFSDGNLASQESAISSKQKKFRKLDFKLIYNDRYNWQSPKYKRARQAEVIYPERLSLDHLNCVWCRSPAEYETLRNLTPAKVWSKWADLVKYSDPHQVFNKRWLHVEEVKLSRERINILFNPPREPSDYGPYNIRVEIDNQDSRESFYFEYEYIVSELNDLTLTISLRELLMDNYIGTIYIDGALAYSGNFSAFDELLNSIVF